MRIFRCAGLLFGVGLLLQPASLAGSAVFNVRELELANVGVSFEQDDLRPAMVCVDVDGLEIDNFKAQLAVGVAAARLEEVKRLVVRNSPVLDGVKAP